MGAEQKLEEYGLLWGVDPKFHDAIIHAFVALEAMHGEPDDDQFDEWFSIVYGLVLQLEYVLECKREHVKKPFNYDDFVFIPRDKKTGRDA